VPTVQVAGLEHGPDVGRYAMHHEPSDGRQSGWKGWIWMALCCVPMVAIVVLIGLGFF